MRITIKNGLRFPGSGELLPVTGLPVHSVAVHGIDYRGLRPRVLVAEGTRVRAGQALFRDRRQSEITVVSPVNGLVSNIRIASRHTIQAIVIRTDGIPDGSAEIQDSAGGASAVASLPLDDLRTRLQAAGLWAAIRQRPGDRVPPPGGMADVVFVTAIDTEPFAPEPGVVLEGQWDDFRAGVLALSRFSKGATWVCASPGFPFTDDPEHRFRLVTFQGPHPAGLPGTHINRLAPLSPGLTAWHVNYQDVAAIGHMLRTGRLRLTRTIGLVGPGVARPALLRVPLGASVADVIRDRIGNDQVTFSGSLLSGHRAEPPFEHLGRYHRQVTVLSDVPPPREIPRPLVRLLNEAPPGILPPMPAGGMLPTDDFDRLWALDCPPAPLLRALLTGDMDSAIALGCLDLGEEDFALPSLVCTGGLDYAACLRETLDAFEREQAN